MKGISTICIVGHWTQESEARKLGDLLAAKLRHLRPGSQPRIEHLDITDLEMRQSSAPVDLCIVVVEQLWPKKVPERLCRFSSIGKTLWLVVMDAYRHTVANTRLLDMADRIFPYSGDAYCLIDTLLLALEDLDHVNKQDRYIPTMRIHLESGGGDIAAQGAMIDKRRGMFITGQTVSVGQAELEAIRKESSVQIEQSPLPDVKVHLLASVFPTAYAYHLSSDDFPFVKCNIHNRSAQVARIAIECMIEDYGVSNLRTVEIPGQETIDVALLPTIKSAALTALTEIRPAMLRITASLLGHGDRSILYDETRRVHLQARDTAILALRSPTGEITSLLNYLAAWITPHHPAMEQLLRQAANYHPNGIFGYQGAGTTEESRLAVRVRV